LHWSPSRARGPVVVVGVCDGHFAWHLPVKVFVHVLAGILGFGPLVAALVVSVRFVRSRVDWRPRLNREGDVNAAAFLSRGPVQVGLSG